MSSARHTACHAIDARLVLLAPQDNCLVACTLLPAGTPLQLEACTLALAHEVPLGHKIARHPLRAGDTVLKYGASIGTLRVAVEAGSHIHTHNLASDYTPTYTLDDGSAFVSNP